MGAIGAIGATAAAGALGESALALSAATSAIGNARRFSAAAGRAASDTAPVAAEATARTVPA